MLKCNTGNLKVHVIQSLTFILKLSFEKAKPSGCTIVEWQNSQCGKQNLQTGEIIVPVHGALRSMRQFGDADCCNKKLVIRLDVLPQV